MTRRADLVVLAAVNCDTCPILPAWRGAAPPTAQPVCDAPDRV